MTQSYLKWILFAALLITLVAKYIYEGSNALSFEEVMAEGSRLVEGKCKKDENVDRWLLQQTWFYDEQFSDLAGAFDQVSFSFYKTITPEIEKKKAHFASMEMIL